MSAPGILYLDSSAIVKLVVAEPESTSLFNLLETGGPASRQRRGQEWRYCAL